MQNWDGFYQYTCKTGTAFRFPITVHSHKRPVPKLLTVLKAVLVPALEPISDSLVDMKIWHSLQFSLMVNWLLIHMKINSHTRYIATRYINWYKWKFSLAQLTKSAELVKWLFSGVGPSVCPLNRHVSFRMGAIGLLLCDEVPLGQVTWQNQKSVPYDFFHGL
jgi:hypothetical protein